MESDAVDTDALVLTRLSLQSVAEHVLAPALHAATGHIGLRATPGGFGTPWFGPPQAPSRRRVRVDGLDLVVEDGAAVARTPMTTVGAAAELVGIQPGAPAGVYPPVTALEPARPLDLDGRAARRLADFYATVDQALNALAGSDEAPVQLWPEHFDLAAPLGQVNYGGSPGDATHPEPYLYVGPWDPPAADGDFWNEAFGASRDAPASLGMAQALAFFEQGRDRLS